MLSFLIIVAVLIILVLAVIAVRMWTKVRQREQEIARAEKLAVKKQAKFRADLCESIQVIGATYLNEDMNPAEAAIRIKVLLDNLSLPESALAEFQAIFRFFDAVGHLDTHAARDALPQQERMQQDLERMKAEARFDSSFRDAVRRLLQSPYLIRH